MGNSSRFPTDSAGLMFENSAELPTDFVQKWSIIQSITGELNLISKWILSDSLHEWIMFKIIK